MDQIMSHMNCSLDYKYMVRFQQERNLLVSGVMTLYISFVANAQDKLIIIQVPKSPIKIKLGLFQCILLVNPNFCQQNGSTFTKFPSQNSDSAMDETPSSNKMPCYSHAIQGESGFVSSHSNSELQSTLYFWHWQWIFPWTTSKLKYFAFLRCPRQSHPHTPSPSMPLCH